MEEPIRISVIGAGYLGATHAACMAELGFDVVAVDRDPDRVTRMSNGQLPFCEPGLESLLRRHVASGRLRFTTDLREAAASADVHFVCVGTPQSVSGPAADLSAVHGVIRELAPQLVRNALVVGKSTVPVGTARVLSTVLQQHAPSTVTASLAWNPEFLRESHGVEDTLAPDRLVLGVNGPDAEHTLRRVYARALAAGTPLHVTDLETAELAKCAANAFLATKISFINAMADLSERSGADVAALADILGDDPRIGRRFLDAGLGFGGGCLPKDIRALAARATELGAGSVTGLLHEVDAINLRMRDHVVDVITTWCGGDVAGRSIAVLGATFKPGSDDVRDSPALDVARRLQAAGAHVRVLDPEGGLNARVVAPSLTYAAHPQAALAGADVVAHLTAWPQFRELDPYEAGRLVRRRLLIDARNALPTERWRLAGWTVHAVGRGPVPEAPRELARLGAPEVTGSA